MAAKSRQSQPKTRNLYTPRPTRERVVALYVAGQSNRAIAASEHLDRETVARILTQRETVNLLAGYRSQILERLIPKSLKALEDALDSDDPRVRAVIAMKLVDKLGGFDHMSESPNAAPPESEQENRRLICLGRLTDMMVEKARRYDLPLPPELEDQQAIPHGRGGAGAGLTS